MMLDIRTTTPPASALEDLVTKKSTMGAAKVADDGADDEEPLKGAKKGQDDDMSGDREFREREYKKTALNTLLKKHLGDHIQASAIRPDNGWARLFQGPPDGDPEKVVVVVDGAERYPSFEAVLYCSLDSSLVLLYIMFFIVFESAVTFEDNGLLSLFCVYFIERFLRSLRASWGTGNLSERAYVDDRFLA